MIERHSQFSKLTEHAMAAKDASTTGANVNLQHRHFAWIARTIAGMTDEMAQRDAASVFAEACARTNPKFDRVRFMRACGL